MNLPAGVGALTSGVGSIAKLGSAGARVAKAIQSTSKVARTVKTLATEGAKAAVDKKVGKSIQVAGVNKDLGEAGVDLATGIVSTPIGGSITKEAVGTVQKTVAKTVEAGLEAMTQIPGEAVKEIIKDEN